KMQMELAGVLDCMEKMELKQSAREELESRARSRVVRAEDARRARLILLLADGEPYTSIQSKLKCNRNYVSRWKVRFHPRTNRLTPCATTGAKAIRSDPGHGSSGSEVDLT